MQCRDLGLPLFGLLPVALCVRMVRLLLLLEALVLHAPPEPPWQAAVAQHNTMTAGPPQP